jgi:hypothetical protein
MPRKKMGPMLWVEYLLLGLIKAAAVDAVQKLPLYWMGTYNALDLYMGHPDYSPFMERNTYCSEERREKWIQSLVTRESPETRPQRKFFSFLEVD